MHNFKDTDEYIAGFPPMTQQLLNEIRAAILQAAPGASEKISYGIPTFDLNGNLVHFAGYKHHIGFYPGGKGIAAFDSELSHYKYAKGSVQFPITEKLPIGLIKKIVQFRVQQNLEKAAIKSKSSKGKGLATICKQGHSFIKSSQCPVCPVCEKNKKPASGFLFELSAPARRAIASKGIKTLQQLSRYTQNEILALHGIGPSSMSILIKALAKEKLHFKRSFSV